LEPRELADLLYTAADALDGAQFTGLLLDDLEHFDNPHVKDAFVVFVDAIENSSGLLIVTAYSKPSEPSLVTLGVKSPSTLAVPELNENDIQCIIQDLGGQADIWSRYVFYASGSGHPQLVQALGRNLAARDWPSEELKNLNALLGDNSEVSRVRDDTRKRLVGSLSPDQLNLLARITLIPGKFDREMVLGIAEGDPPIPNAGHGFDALIGPWINEPYDGVYQTSPLVSDLAVKTISEVSRLKWQRLIANKMTSGRSLDAGKMNAALMMALASDEKSVLMRISIATIQLDNEELSKLGVTFFALQTMRTDRPLYEADPYVNVVMRISQFLLVANEPDWNEARTREIWNALIRELKLVEDHEGAEALELMVLSKSVLTMVGRWGGQELVGFLYRIYEIARKTEYDELRDAYNVRHKDQQTSSFSIMFLMHAQAFKKITDTLDAFTAIDRYPQSFRQVLFASLTLPEMDSEMYLNGPWLKEHSAETLDAAIHAPIYRKIADIARGWGMRDLAVTATKYQAVIIDEYGNDPDEALRTLNVAQDWAGVNNWEIVRAEGKIHFREKRYPEALALFKRLADIAESDSSCVERAFAFREAGIAAANTGDWKLAENFFATAREAAQSSDLQSMYIMATGLLGDMGVARWHYHDRAGFVAAFDQGLSEVAKFAINESLNAKHCHALYRHAILWAQDQLTGDVTIGNGEKPAILPGALSNPEPSPSIANNKIAALDIARYMLAALELQYGLPSRVRLELTQKLDGKRILVGETWYDNHALNYYLGAADAVGTVATSLNMAQTTVIGRMSRPKDLGLDLENPEPFADRDLTVDEGKSVVSLFQTLILGSAIYGLVEGRLPFLADLFRVVRQLHLNVIEPAFALPLYLTREQSKSFEAALSGRLAEAGETIEPARLQPIQLLHLHLLILQAPPGTVIASTRPKLGTWMRQQWLDVVSNQGFLLTTPGQLARDLHRLTLDVTAPISSAAKVIQQVMDHVPGRLPPEFRTMLSNVASSRD
jgi:tetratricopeptide (TPR) repeat protein